MAKPLGKIVDSVKNAQAHETRSHQTLSVIHKSLVIGEVNVLYIVEST